MVSEGGFDRAALKLSLTQSAVSQRIRLLEEQLGRILVRRSSPPVPTRDGQKLLAHFGKVQRLEYDVLSELESSPQGFDSLGIAINADSMATWFLPVMRDFCLGHNLLLDLRMDDQDQTLKMLKNGEVLACISALDEKVQGCNRTYLGDMYYRLLASPEYITRWCPQGFDFKTTQTAPLVLFNRKDKLHLYLFKKVFGQVPDNIFCHYFPSSEGFVDFIASGLGAGLIPDQQSKSLLNSGKIVDTLPGHFVRVSLYWYCWNINSSLIRNLTKILEKEMVDKI